MLQARVDSLESEVSKIYTVREVAKALPQGPCSARLGAPPMPPMGIAAHFMLRICMGIFHIVWTIPVGIWKRFPAFCRFNQEGLAHTMVVVIMLLMVAGGLLALSSLYWLCFGTAYSQTTARVLSMSGSIQYADDDTHLCEAGIEYTSIKGLTRTMHVQLEAVNKECTDAQLGRSVAMCYETKTPRVYHLGSC